MIDKEIFLYSQLELHADALNKLVIIGIDTNDFEKVEKYCYERIQDRPNLFKILSENYNLKMNAAKSSKNEGEKKY